MAFQGIRESLPVILVNALNLNHASFHRVRDPMHGTLDRPVVLIELWLISGSLDPHLCARDE